MFKINETPNHYTPTKGGEVNLFDKLPETKGTCKDCEHRQRWQCGGRVIQYCGITRSNITDNGLKKIKVYQTCYQFEERK